MWRRWCRLLLGVLAAVLVLSLPVSADAAGAPITIGANTLEEASQAAVAVDSSGTAYIAWLAPSTPSDTEMDFCKLAPGASSCAPVGLPSPTSAQFFDPPSVLLEGGDVYVFEDVDGATNADLNGIDEFVSTDGGATFTLTANAVSFLPDGEGTVNPVIPLPGSNIGVGAVVPVGNPEFQANSLTSPLDYSNATTASSPVATLNPSAPAYDVGNLSGQFASQLTGTMGVLGVFRIIETGPCPASGGLVYAYAPLSASTTAGLQHRHPSRRGRAEGARPAREQRHQGDDPIPCFPAAVDIRAAGDGVGAGIEQPVAVAGRYGWDLRDDDQRRGPAARLQLNRGRELERPEDADQQ